MSQKEKCYHKDPGGAFTEENCPCPCSFCAENNHGHSLQKESEWDEREVNGAIMDFQIHVRKETGGNNYSCVDSTELKKAINNTVQTAISKRENEIAEEVEKLKNKAIEDSAISIDYSWACNDILSIIRH